MLSLGRRVFVSSALVASLFAGSSREAAAQRSSSSFAGQRLGKNRYGEEVKVVREVGSSGYDDRLQATAAARMTGSEAVLVRTRDGKWHALATTANAYGGLASAADDSEVRELVPLPSTKGIAAARKNGVDVAYIALVLGVDTKEINLTFMKNQREARFINVNAKLDPQGDILGAHGPEKAPYQELKPGIRTAIELNRLLFERGDPRAASAVLFHEASHRADYELAQRWVQAYERQEGSFKPGRHFAEWLSKRTPRLLARDEAQTVIEITNGADGATEARAYIGTFIAAMQAGAPDLAREQLLTYARRIAGRIPPTGEYVPAALRSDLETAYRSLDDSGKRQFDAAFAAVKTAASSTWIAKFEHGAAKRS